MKTRYARSTFNHNSSRNSHAKIIKKEMTMKKLLCRHHMMRKMFYLIKFNQLQVSLKLRQLTN
jgi:hypothetical protein